ncbi:MAG: DNA-directed DNA polymerase I [Nitrososphaeria archaeon]
MDPPTPAQLIEKLSGLTEHSDDVPESLLIGAGYDGQRKLAFLQFYEPKSQRIYFHYDGTGHKPYFYTRAPPEALAGLRDREDVLELRVEEKLDLLNDSRAQFTRVVVDDPLAVSGSGSRRGLRDLVGDAYEADITYYLNYLYDLGVHPGAFYRVESGSLRRVDFDVPDDLRAVLARTLERVEPDFRAYVEEWAGVLGQPFPSLRRAALDIEVITEQMDRVPDPQRADQKVISASLVGSDGAKRVYLLRRPEMEEGERRLPPDVQELLFDSEEDLLLALFNDIMDYPIIVTFNGDDFDLPYLYHRALKFGVPREAIPISLGRNEAHVRHGVHVDLYKVFNNRAIQGYAFNNRYSEHTLNALSEALLGMEKVEFEGSIGDLPLEVLAHYNYTDSELTYRLTEFNGELLMKLLITIMRVAKMPMADVARTSVSNWIRSLLIFEHRRLGAVVPRKEDLESRSVSYSKAVIKDKKYRGGLVIEPVPGVHFNVVVLDFASLYPSIIKVYNISYETVRCPHEECRNDPSRRVPDTAHWICKRRRGVTSLLIGSLRDIRVDYFKALSKRPGVTEEEKEFYSVISQALKVILNASYGVMGFENFALYYLPVAEATTAYGRWAITQTLNRAREMGLEVIYGDTDSLFVRSPGEEQIRELTGWAKERLGIDLEVDKVFRYVAFSERKKNYIGVYQDGRVEVKGLTGKKSNTPDYIKKVFYEVLEVLSRVNSEQDFERASSEIRRMIRQAYLDIKNRRVPLEGLAFRVMLSKPIDQYKDTTPQHVKAARMLRNAGKDVKPGDIISYVKTAGGLGVKPLSMARPDDIDVDKYVEYLRSTFEQLLDALGYSFEEIMGITSIDEFFS